MTQRSTSQNQRTYADPLTPAQSADLSAVLEGKAMEQQTTAAPTKQKPRPADPCPGAALLLARVPREDRTIARGYLNSRQPQDEAKGRAFAEQYGLDYDRIRLRWGVEPVSVEVELENGERVRL